MDVSEAIKQRRSIRKYEEKVVGKREVNNQFEGYSTPALSDELSTLGFIVSSHHQTRKNNRVRSLISTGDFLYLLLFTRFKKRHRKEK